VQPSEQGTNGGRIGAAHLAVDEARDEHSVGKAHHLRADAEPGSHDRGLVLVLPVDPEQGRVLAADAQDQHVAVDDDLEVVVGDPAAERLDAERLDVHRLFGPEPPDGLLDAHARS
jgi:hypothetical protein